MSELTGEPVDTSSDAWRHECECRWLLDNKPSKSDKHLYLYGVWDREQLFEWNAATGQAELAQDWVARIPKANRPLMKVRSLAAADRILEDAKRIWARRQKARE